jgi:hypothetical protein
VKKTQPAQLALKMKERPPAKECGQPQEAGKGKETDCPLELPEGAQPK